MNTPKPCPGLPGDAERPCGKPRNPWKGYCDDCTRRYHRRRYHKSKGHDRAEDRLQDPDRPRAWDPEYQEYLRDLELEGIAKRVQQPLRPSDPDDEFAFLIEPPTPVEMMEEPIETVSVEEWEQDHATSQILSQDIRGEDPTHYLPTETWEDGEYRPHRLGPPEED